MGCEHSARGVAVAVGTAYRPAVLWTWQRFHTLAAHLVRTPILPARIQLQRATVRTAVGAIFLVLLCLEPSVDALVMEPVAAWVLVSGADQLDIVAEDGFVTDGANIRRHLWCARIKRLPADDIGERDGVACGAASRGDERRRLA